MKLYLPDDIRMMDANAIAGGIGQQLLMENAGSATARIISKRFPRCSVFTAVGSGHNGGDGLTAARYLSNYGYSVAAFIINRDKMDDIVLKELELAKKSGVGIIDSESCSAVLSRSDIIIDAIFGTGLTREVKGDISSLIDNINKTKKPIISCDIPSGISGDSGIVNGIAINADITVTYQEAKSGLMTSPGFKYAGTVFVEDIGIPSYIIKQITPYALFTEKDNLPSIPKRSPDSHKGSFGHLLIIGGSKGKSGAVIMAANSALRIGTGLVSCAIPESINTVVATSVISAMSIPLPCENGAMSYDAVKKLPILLDKKTAVAIGPGLSVTAATKSLVRNILRAPITKIIDADGLNCTDTEQLKRHKGDLIITPHPGEFAKLVKKTVDIVQNNRTEFAKQLSNDINGVVVLKGARTVIASRGQLWINGTGGPALAKGGSGDYLTGFIAGLSAQGMKPEDAAVLGVWIHGKAADIAESKYGTISVLPTDLDEFTAEAVQDSAFGRKKRIKKDFS